jgi:hypothetical protein
MDGFVNRAAELAALQQWWDRSGTVAALWGRRRVGKTALADVFAHDKRSVFHCAAGRGEQGELEQLSYQVALALPEAADGQGRDGTIRHGPDGLSNQGGLPYRSWTEAFTHLRSLAVDEPLLLVLDNVAMLADLPRLADALRELDTSSDGKQLRVLLVSSSVRRMETLQAQGQVFHDLATPTLTLRPFTPHEAAAMLEPLSPTDRARVYGMVGGIPLYLRWWDPETSVEANLHRLVCEPGAPLLAEGDLLLGADLEDLGFNDRVLHALAQGHTSYNDVRDWAGTEPARPLDRLIELRLIERVLPVGENRQARRRRYRITDPFVRFHVGIVARHRSEIDRGLAAELAQTLLGEADQAMDDVWRDAFHLHLAELALSGSLPTRHAIAGLGPWWDNTGFAEIDALALSRDSHSAVLAGTASWAPTIDAAAAIADLQGKVERGLGAYPDDLTYAVCARDEVQNTPYNALALTAADLFSPLT